MKKRIVTSVLVGSLVFTPLVGISTVWSDDTSSSESQAMSSELFDSTVEMSDSLVKLDELSDETMEVLSSEEVFESESTLESNEVASTNESTVESTEEVQYENVYYNGQWFQFPIQEEPIEEPTVDTSVNYELGTFANATARSVADIVSETQTGRPDWDFIDVASYQGNLSVADYEFMKKHGITGVVVKLTEGTTYKNPYAANQIKNALAAGMKVSTYHFSHFTTKSGAEAEAAYYAKMAKELGLPGTTVMVNDLETKFNDFSTQNSVYFANKLKELGYPITLHYSSSSVFERNILSTAILGLKNLWVAQYPYQPSDKNILHTTRSAWQWSAWMEFSAVKDSKGKRKRFDINMDHSGMLSNKFVVSDEVVKEDEIPTLPTEKAINGYATVTKKGFSIWNNLLFTAENNKTDNYYQKTLYVETEYTFSDSTVVVSLKDTQGKLIGYVDSTALSFGSSKGGAYISDGRYVTIRSQNYTLWQNLNFSKSKGISSAYYTQTVQAKGRYQHFNGSTYYSIYSTNGTWLGYINATGVKEGSGKQGAYQSYGKYVTIKSNSYAIWRDFGWSSKASGDFAGKTYLAKGIYNHFNGSKYLSLYDAQGKWIGYINASGAKVGNGKQGAYQSYNKYVTIKSNSYAIWKNFGWSNKASGNFAGKTYLAKGIYNHFSGSKYLSLYDGNNTWVGYINQNGSILGTSQEEKFIKVQELLNKEYKNQNFGIYVKSLSDGSTAQINGNKQFHAASTGKLPALYYTQKMILEKKVDGNKLFAYTEAINQMPGAYMRGGAGVLQGQPYGKKFSLNTIMNWTAKYSDNQGTNFLAYYAANKYDTTMKKEISTIMGREWTSPFYVNAKDNTMMLEAIYRQGGKLINDMSNTVYDDQRIPKYLPVQVAHKIGDVNDLRHDAGIIYSKEPYVLSVLTQNYQSYEKISVLSKKIYDILK